MNEIIKYVIVIFNMIEFNFENKDFLCIRSDNTSKNIANFLKNCD